MCSHPLSSQKEQGGGLPGKTQSQKRSSDQAGKGKNQLTALPSHTSKNVQLTVAGRKRGLRSPTGFLTLGLALLWHL